jgi:hypothetical protein
MRQEDAEQPFALYGKTEGWKCRLRIAMRYGYGYGGMEWWIVIAYYNGIVLLYCSVV